MNAAHSLLEKDEFILSRSEAYAGVLIDDLVTKGTREPYRMFTSRAEHRLVLREDNSIDRLAEISKKIGLVSEKELNQLMSIKDERTVLLGQLQSTVLYPKKAVNDVITEMGSKPLVKPVTMEEFLRRPEIGFPQLEKLDFKFSPNEVVTEAVEIEVKYSGYVKKQYEIIEQSKKLEMLEIPQELVFSLVKGLSNEEVDKLNKVKPRTLGQAQRISGVNPSAIQAIMIYLKGHKLA